MADPRSLKRPRGSSSSNSEGSAGEATARGSLFFDQFLAMPEEIRGRILDLAYHLPLSTPSAHSKLSTTPPIDISNTINLACTCRWLYLRTTFWFWRDIRITRPSALQSIQRAVSSHPQLGRIIKSLHVGPEDELAEVRRYPIMWRPHAGSSGGSIRISSSLRSAKEVQLLPRWCTPHSEWPVEHNDAHGTSEAISGALRAVERSLSYRLERYLSWQSAQTWDLAYQAQAALDLYLMSMRRLEDEHGPLTADTDSKSCSSSIIKDKQPLNYPALVLVGTEAQPTLTPASNFSSQLVLTRQQLLQHIARPGSATDSFDHPLLFARSGFDARAQGTRSRLARKEPELRIQREPEDAADVFTSEGVDNINEPKNRYTDSLDFLDITHVNAPTAGSILAILRSLLAMTPRLSNLSLTGFLERAFCGSRLGAQLKSLRCLTLGPPPALRSWHMPMNLGGLDNGGLNRVEKIRICGVMLRGDEAAKMEYRFYTTHWTMLERVSGRDLLRLVHE